MYVIVIRSILPLVNSCSLLTVLVFFYFEYSFLPVDIICTFLRVYRENFALLEVHRRVKAYFDFQIYFIYGVFDGQDIILINFAKQALEMDIMPDSWAIGLMNCGLCFLMQGSVTIIWLSAACHEELSVSGNCTSFDIFAWYQYHQ